MPIDKIHQYLQATAVTLGIFVPCILLAGHVFYLGSTMPFGLDSTVITRGLGDTVAEAWMIGITLLSYLFSRWWYLLVFLLIISTVLLAVIYFVFCFDQNGTYAEKLEISKQKPGREIFGLTLFAWKGWLSIVLGLGACVYAPLVALVFTAFIIVIPYQMGEKNAKEKIENVQKMGCSPPSEQISHIRCTTLTDLSAKPPAPIFTGILVSSNSSHVALFDGATLEVFPLTDNVKLSKPHPPLEASPKP